MSKVLHIRDVPDEVHHVLAETAQSEGLSLTRYVQRELHHIACRAEAVKSNAEVIRRTQAQVQGHVDRQVIQAALDEGRGE